MEVSVCCSSAMFLVAEAAIFPGNVKKNGAEFDLYPHHFSRFSPDTNAFSAISGGKSAEPVALWL